MRLIDADALRRWMYHGAFEVDSGMQKWDSGLWIRYKMFENGIESAPTIDAVPVVRCRECQNWETDWEPIYFDPENPRYFCGEIDRYPGGDWYCSMGERREDGDT